MQAASKLSRDLARRLKGLSYEPIHTRDVMPGGVTQPAGHTPAKTDAAGGSSDDDSDFGADASAAASPTEEDVRAVPPCFKVRPLSLPPVVVATPRRFMGISDLCFEWAITS